MKTTIWFEKIPPNAEAGVQNGVFLQRRWETAILHLRPLCYVIALVLGLQLVNSAAAAAAEPEWLYAVKPGDTLIGDAADYLANPNDWHQIQKLNNVTELRRLTPGTKLRLPLVLLKREAAIAEVIHVQGEVTRTPKNDRPQNTLPALVASVIKETELDAAHLELEITESAAMKNPQRSIEILNMLRSMGITLALDDFGTGHSSLTYLKLFPITTLKIDKSFVGDIETDHHAAEICASTISLAHKLGLNVVAEGVENA